MWRFFLPFFYNGVVQIFWMVINDGKMFICISFKLLGCCAWRHLPFLWQFCTWILFFFLNFAPGDDSVSFFLVLLSFLILFLALLFCFLFCLIDLPIGKGGGGGGEASVSNINSMDLKKLLLVLVFAQGDILEDVGAIFHPER